MQEQPGAVRTRRYVCMALALALITALFAISMTLGIGKAEAQAAGPYAKLSELTVRPAGTMDGYSRDKFPHWSNAIEYNWTIPDGDEPD